MRKFKIVAAIVMAMGLLQSCSSDSLESDAKKVAHYQCEMQKLYGKDDEKSKTEMEKLQKDMEAFTAKLEKKYGDKKGAEKDSMDARAERIINAEMEKCK